MKQAAAVPATLFPVHVQCVLPMRTEVKRNQTKALFAQGCFFFFFFKKEQLNRIPEIARTYKSQELCQRLKVSINSPLMLNLSRS